VQSFYDGDIREERAGEEGWKKDDVVLIELASYRAW
jgi:hypothetical protein